MKNPKVTITKLDRMRIAAVQCISNTPEKDTWAKLRAWAEPLGLFHDLEGHPVFGFNNPPPTDESKGYGYELWIRIDANTKPEGEIIAKDFAGGLYAVTTCKLLGDANGSIQDVWQQLWQWVQASDYKWRRTHELEKPQDPLASVKDMVLDLYLPIES